MLFKIVYYQFFSKLLHFTKTLKKVFLNFFIRNKLIIDPWLLVSETFTTRWQSLCSKFLHNSCLACLCMKKEKNWQKRTIFEFDAGCIYSKYNSRRNFHYFVESFTIFCFILSPLGAIFKLSTSFIKIVYKYYCSYELSWYINL